MKDILDIPRTAMEVFELLPEGTACEVIDNTLYMSPSPTTNHQEILGNIFAEIHYHIKHRNLGKAFMAPCDVYLNNGQNVVQPDILFIKKDRGNIIQTKGVYGSPDLIIEILSTNKIHDQERKLELYRQNLVPEYVIIDPETKQVWHYILIGGKYSEKIGSDHKSLNLEQLDLVLSF
ncbi:Uma2 family endonuclease [Mucilaginibacter agri]|uniref:Uma2 family endonuclease n=1 Tax=Mucilaginibacter agri TaxID=2695265 RepID=A0A966DSE7_9SPHI|nr:Uma2 family endonuclease [Mucilaginibacter agri]NCD68167.1 Uma2 family endonuclease [Mucilaginibacter agri]